MTSHSLGHCWLASLTPCGCTALRWANIQSPVGFSKMSLAILNHITVYKYDWNLKKSFELNISNSSINTVYADDLTPQGISIHCLASCHSICIPVRSICQSFVSVIFVRVFLWSIYFIQTMKLIADISAAEINRFKLHCSYNYVPASLIIKSIWLFTQWEKSAGVLLFVARDKV